eukprot:gene6080-8376_t
MKKGDLDDHPLDQIWFSSFIVAWISPLIKLATTRMIREDDMWECPKNMSVDANTLRFETAWKEELINAKRKKSPSVKLALWLGFGNDLIVAGFYQFAFLCFQLAQPFVIGEIIRFVKTGEQGQSYGIGLAFAFGGVSSSMALSATFYSLRILGCRIRSSITMSIYKHTLQLTTSARYQNTVGQTTNLVAIDSEKFFLGVQLVNFLWYTPLVSLIAMLILISEVGYAPALADLGWYLILIPAQNFLAAQIGCTRRSMIKFTDERVKLINEILQSIRVIKVYAWEVPMENRVLQTRNDELKLLHKYLNKSAQLREMLFSAQSVTALVIILTSVYGCNRPLTLVQTFRILAFLNITRFPLNQLGQALKTYKDGEYCAQTAWIQNMSLQDNVLFGADLSDKTVNDYQVTFNRYQNAIKAAALLPDLQILPFGENTEIGERGINLSWRALFSSNRTDIADGEIIAEKMEK